MPGLGGKKGRPGYQRRKRKRLGFVLREGGNVPETTAKKQNSEPYGKGTKSSGWPHEPEIPGQSTKSQTKNKNASVFLRPWKEYRAATGNNSQGGFG